MKLIRCNNGHFYDQDKFGTCPSCNAGAADTVTEAFAPAPGMQQQVQPQSMVQQQPMVSPQQQSINNFQMKPEANYAAPSEDHTIGLGYEIPGEAHYDNGPANQSLVQDDFVAPNEQSEIHYNSDPEAFVSHELDRALNQSNVTIPLNQPQNVAISQSLGESIAQPAQQPRPQSSPMIQPMELNIQQPVINSFNIQPQEDDDYTVAITPGGKTVGTTGLKPVVGWLICLNGKHLGKDFRLVQGKNFIGRDLNMDVCLEGEKTVSREKHALIVYEPKHHLYLIQSGDSKELTYVNDKVILESKELHAYDQILLGDVKLLFIPLCNKEFNWTEVLEEGNEETEE